MYKYLLFLSLILSGCINLKAQTQPRLILPIGHSGEVTACIFSPNKKLALTFSDKDETPCVWDVETGKMLFQLIGHKAPVSFATFSPSGNMIFTISSHDGTTTGASDTTARIWDATKGIELHCFKVKTGNISLDNNFISSQVFSQDEKYIIIPDDKTARIWDLSSGKEVQSFKGHTSYICSAVFSPDDKMVATSSSSNENDIRIWDVLTGTTIHILTGHQSHVESVVFSPDGTKLLSVSFDKTARIWSVESGNLIHVFKHKSYIKTAKFGSNGKLLLISSLDGSCHLWNVNTGKVLHTFESYNDGSVLSCDISKNNKYIVTAQYSGTRIWSVENGNLIKALKGDKSMINFIEFNHDGNLIITGSEDNAARVWDVSEGVQKHILKGHTTESFNSVLSPDGKTAITFGLDWWRSKDYKPRIWDVFSGKFVCDFNGHTGPINSVDMSNDNKFVVTASDDYSVRIWNAENGKELHKFNQKDIVNSVIFSHNAKYVLLASHDNVLKKEIATGVDILKFKGHKGKVCSIDLSSDESFLLTASSDGTVRIWNSLTAKELKVFKVSNGWDGAKITARFSPDSKLIVVRNQYSYTRIDAEVWNVDTGKLMYKLTGHSGRIQSVEISKDAKYLLTAPDDNTARIWEVSTGKQIIILKGHEGSVNTATFTTDGMYVLTSGNDDKSVLWNTKTGKQIYTQLQLKNNDWLVFDEHYRYDGSEGARNYLYFVCGTEIIDLAQMKDALYVPGLLQKIMSGQDINYPKLSELDICDALPIVERIESEQTDYHYKITPRRLELAYVEVYLNEKKIFTYQPSELKQKQGVYNLEMKAADISKHFISGTENKVNVVAIARQGNTELRSRGAILVEEVENKNEKTTPKLFAVMIGVNDYKDQALKLNFPAKDAAGLGKALEMSAVKLLGKENVFMYHINSHVTKDNGYTTPEKEGIRRALADIGQKARPEDIIMLFFAGHGVMQGAGDKMFTFLTAEASSENLSGISTRELQDWLSYEGPHKILANKTILIFDACNSGQATQELLTLARSDDDTRRIRQVEDLKDKSGMFILAASAPNQSAYELPQYGQGLLTYSLLSVLKNNPDILDDGKFLNVQKWFLESEKYLKEIVESLGYKQDAQPFGTANIRIGIVDEEVANSIVLAKEKPVVMCANVLNTNIGDDDLKLKELINKELIVVSERGVNSIIVFTKQETPTSNKINIMYQVQGDSVNCQIRLLKGNETLHQAVVNGSKGDLTALVSKIIEEVLGYAK